MSQYPSFRYTFSIYLIHVYPSVDFISKYFTATSPEEFFFIGNESIYFFHGEESYKKLP